MELYEQKQENDTREAIVETIAFFDLFDFPLTVFEIWKYINIKCSFYDVSEILNNIDDLPIGQEKGFYFLRGRNNIIKIRMQRYYFAGKKYRRAKLVAGIFKIIPWIKMIAIGNIIGAHNLKKESDIDLFIIANKNRLWITRFFCVILAILLLLRPSGEKKRNKICLSFFISEDKLDLENIMLDSNRGVADIYFIYWLIGLEPVYGTEKMFNKFTLANNWIRKYLPNEIDISYDKYKKIVKDYSGFYEDTLELFFGGLESNTKNLQLRMMSGSLREMMNKDTRVIINDDILKLHTNDRREEFRRAWKSKLRDIEMARWILNP